MYETTDRNSATEQFSSVVNARKQSVSYLSDFLNKLTFQKLGTLTTREVLYCLKPELSPYFINRSWQRVYELFTLSLIN